MSFLETCEDHGYFIQHFSSSAQFSVYYIADPQYRYKTYFEMLNLIPSSPQCKIQLSVPSLHKS